MKKSGCLRRICLLLGFAWFYNGFVLSDARFIEDPQAREWIRWILYGGVAWGILTLLAQRLVPGAPDDKEDLK